MDWCCTQYSLLTKGAERREKRPTGSDGLVIGFLPLQRDRLRCCCSILVDHSVFSYVNMRVYLLNAVLWQR